MKHIIVLDIPDGCVDQFLTALSTPNLILGGCAITSVNPLADGISQVTCGPSECAQPEELPPEPETLPAPAESPAELPVAPVEPVEDPELQDVPAPEDEEQSIPQSFLCKLLNMSTAAEVPYYFGEGVESEIFVSSLVIEGDTASFEFGGSKHCIHGSKDKMRIVGLFQSPTNDTLWEQRAIPVILRARDESADEKLVVAKSA